MAPQHALVRYSPLHHLPSSTHHHTQPSAYTLNSLPPSSPNFLDPKVTTLPVRPDERPGLKRTLEIDRTGRAYGSIQETKPQTIGYALADSPVGLLAWIYEKLVAWTDRYEWTDDEGAFFLSFFRLACASLLV